MIPSLGYKCYRCYIRFHFLWVTAMEPGKLSRYTELSEVYLEAEKRLSDHYPITVICTKCSQHSDIRFGCYSQSK